MKIRIKGNSIRYRLTKTEVACFTKDNYLEEAIDFGSQRLTYALQRSFAGELTAEFANNKITLYVPDSIAEEWTTTDKVGFESSNNVLNILVEKDFQCLDNVEEDQSDNYPNPNTLIC
jgi:hypothetical protein